MGSTGRHLRPHQEKTFPVKLETNMQIHSPRYFPSAASVHRIGEGLLDCSLDKSEWTHEAHLAASAWLVLERPDIVPERDLPHLIRRFNESKGGVNDDTQGYHETITQLYLRGVRRYLDRTPTNWSLTKKINGLLDAPEGSREWPLQYYSKQVLFSTKARATWVEPDLRAM